MAEKAGMVKWLAQCGNMDPNVKQIEEFGSTVISSFAVIAAVSALAEKINNIREKVRANNRMCRRLADRVISIRSSLVRLGTKLHEARLESKVTLNEDEYRLLYTQLRCVLRAIERAHDLIQAWGADARGTFFGKLKRALLSNDFHEEFVECNQELSEHLADLRGEAMLQMFMKSISLPSSDAWREENCQDSVSDLQ
eukprot:gene25439-31069_t